MSKNPLSLLRFNAETGHIWLDEQRMLLVHARALAALRKELFDSLGVERARGLLIRLGFASGQRDGEYAARQRRAGTRTDEAFLLGPQLHSIEGVVSVKPVRVEINLAQGHFYGEFLWLNSWEDEVNIADFGFGDDPACWSQIGYASGYSSAFMGQLIIYKEVECHSLGDASCRIIGKPAAAWGDDPYLAYFSPSDFTSLAIDYPTPEPLRVPARRRYDSKLVGASTAFRSAFDLLQRAADRAINVLLLGETGVGKEVFARWLHEKGSRAKGPFVAVNCAAIPHDLIEAELFGVEKGAYTGAHLARAGRFERAHGGTLFLDEIGDLPLSAQAKLLRALQGGEIERLGAEHSTQVNVRIVAATNVDLLQAMQAGRFRTDLYYRLSTFPITIPPLRERGADIPVLVERFIEKFNEHYGKQIKGLTDKAMRALLGHRWPGNIRELENVIERAILLAPDQGAIELSHLPGVAAPAIAGQLDGKGGITETPSDALDEICLQVLDKHVDLGRLEQRLLQLALQQAKGNLSQASRLLGITRPQLAYRLKKEGLAT